jgi:hypothetical protein
VSAIVVAILATTLFVVGSTRSIRLLPQQGTQMLPNPIPSPEHGAFPVATLATTLLFVGSIRERLFLAILEIQMAPSPMPAQSGLPGIEILARIGKAEIGR